MTVQGNRASGRALIVIAALLIAVIVLFDLALPDSFLRSLWSDLSGGNPVRDLLRRTFRR